MSEIPPKAAPKTPKIHKTEAERRAERLAEQLRANLHRRKAQARAMGEPAAGEDGDAGGD